MPLLAIILDWELGKKFKLVLETRDIVAIALLVVSVGAVIVSAIIAIGIAVGTVDAEDGGAIAVGLLGGGAMLGLATLALRGSESRRAQDGDSNSARDEG